MLAFGSATHTAVQLGNTGQYNTAGLIPSPTTTAGGLLQQGIQYAAYPYSIPDTLVESWAWVKVQWNPDMEGKKKGENVGILLINSKTGETKKIAMKDLVVLAGWEW